MRGVSCSERKHFLLRKQRSCLPRGHSPKAKMQSHLGVTTSPRCGTVQYIEHVWDGATCMIRSYLSFGEAFRRSGYLDRRLSDRSCNYARIDSSDDEDPAANQRSTGSNIIRVPGDHYSLLDHSSLNILPTDLKIFERKRFCCTVGTSRSPLHMLIRQE